MSILFPPHNRKLKYFPFSRPPIGKLGIKCYIKIKVFQKVLLLGIGDSQLTEDFPEGQKSVLRSRRANKSSIFSLSLLILPGICNGKP